MGAFFGLLQNFSEWNNDEQLLLCVAWAAEAYLEPSWTSTMEIFGENS